MKLGNLIFLVILACGLIAAWFPSGCVAAIAAVLLARFWRWPRVPLKRYFTTRACALPATAAIVGIGFAIVVHPAIHEVVYWLTLAVAIGGVVALAGIFNGDLMTRALGVEFVVDADEKMFAIGAVGWLALVALVGISPPQPGPGHCYGVGMSSYVAVGSRAADGQLCVADGLFPDFAPLPNDSAAKAAVSHEASAPDRVERQEPPR